MSVYKLRKIYKKHNIRKKTVVKQASNPRKYNTEAFSEMIKEVQEKLIEADREGYTIF